MRLEQKAKFSKIITGILTLLKILLCLLLVVIVFAWLVQVFEAETSIPFWDKLYDFLSRLSYIFYTPTKDDDENFNAIMYMAVAIVFFLLIFETATDILSDIVKLHQKNKEKALAEENDRINKQIQENYKAQLQTVMRFIIMLKLDISLKPTETQAFKDEDFEKKQLLNAQNIVKNIYSMLTMSIKCQIKSTPESLTFFINNSEQLNKALNFIESVCNVEKYQKNGVGYYIAVTAYMSNEPYDKALNDAKILLDLQSKNKILCYQIISECLNTVSGNYFKAVSNGE